MRRGKKVMINVISSLFQQAILMICGLVTQRLMLRSFGSTYNGVISSATQLLGMISFLTLGVAGALRAELYPALACKDTDRISQIMRAANTYMHKIGFGVIVYAVALMFIFPYISNSDIPHAESAIIIGIVAIDCFALYYFGTNNYQLIVSDQKGYIKSTLSSIVAVLNACVIWLLIHFDNNVFIVKGGSVLVNLITPIAIMLYVNNHYHLNPKIPFKKDILKRRNDAAFHSIANIIHDDTDTIILTVFMDIKFVSVYTIYYGIVGKIKSIIAETSLGIEAAIGEMWAKNENAQLLKIFRMYEYVMSEFVIVVFSCVGVLLVPFVKLFTEQVTDINYLRPDFALLIMAAETVFCLRQPYRVLVHATGFYKETKKAAMMEAIINLISSVILVQFLGLNGVVIGTLIANLYRTLSYVLFTSKNILNRDINEVIYRIIWTVACLSITIICSGYITNMILLSGWFGWIIKGLIAFTISLLISFIMSIFFYRDDIKSVKSILVSKFR